MANSIAKKKSISVRNLTEVKQNRGHMMRYNERHLYKLEASVEEGTLRGSSQGAPTRQERTGLRTQTGDLETIG